MFKMIKIIVLYLIFSSVALASHPGFWRPYNPYYPPVLPIVPPQLGYVMPPPVHGYPGVMPYYNYGYGNYYGGFQPRFRPGHHFYRGGWGGGFHGHRGHHGH
ncbi:hypothetical protein MGMO_159c00040 [Methyloglobulus morosus KoM1]|uniref:Uncharacterized protein n=1 Tax=Methyloglobulus morosus KoM1 TaxID=1116472 RepID=V5BNI8_9GAMM|nr:hypothetical protein MGMO_159c00040 [Methyloglobulus morosus KoM1]